MEAASETKTIVKDEFCVFQEKDKMFVFHFCGKDEKSQWFRKTEDWDSSEPKCEVCKKLVPENIAAIVRIYQSGL